jgi:TRAP-type mannitol/chloroaromatic compound transport system substrate-binding protein
MTASKFHPTRRQVLAGAAALPLFSIASRPAHAAEFNYKFATGQDPSHPVNKRAQEAIDRIRNATGGRLDIKLFPANQLGSDTDLLSQIRNGGVEFFNQASVVLSTLVPAAGTSTRASRSMTTTRSGKRWTVRSAPTCARKSRRSACSRCPSPGTTASAT